MLAEKTTVRPHVLGLQPFCSQNAGQDASCVCSMNPIDPCFLRFLREGLILNYSSVLPFGDGLLWPGVPLAGPTAFMTAVVVGKCLHAIATDCVRARKNAGMSANPCR